MFSPPYVLELFMKQRQQDLLAQAKRDHLARLARRSEPRSPELPARLLVGLGKMLVVLGYRLQSRYPDGHGTAGSVRGEPHFPLGSLDI